MPMPNCDSDGNDHAPLNQSDALALAAIVRAAHDGKKVGRLMPDGHALAGEVLYGIARHIVVDDSAVLAGDNDDIRDCYLRVTGTSGLSSDYYWRVSDLVAEYRASTFSPV